MKADRRDLEFSPEVRALAVARHTIGGVLRCPACGQPIRGRPAHHHRKRKGPGEGDGRLVNDLPVHGRLDGPQCHHTRVHEAVAMARYRRHILVSSLPESAYAEPVWDEARRIWVVFLAEAPLWRPATAGEIVDLIMGGAYEQPAGPVQL